ncbi:hypothetical protein SASPL_152439 [Salvia splendens]|uniref:GTD-binding domain-containing protein n=1 Tax=Salvia splendens TaxID=180675 RepID=A0A8X8Z018_SALSN|nr:hypothetical protein SASPL_152439 [Salvia splendens]
MESMPQYQREVKLRFRGVGIEGLVKMERRRADAALAEVERERSASATTAEEAMAMIQRLQREKNSIEIATNQQ